ncbi:FadR family transcriptional regulator [Aureimonas fodinaquatilis]|uniref:FadR family transcriptional regulator n=1 Tax=Aureimonas fodinaquatilis TaxID=2565783 RepID=A0A5B0DPN2_9HYPH|nr:FadR/GntR family transcriptional regulator [Aureimonas fodinaquatilis]KAA0968436.1 FadR family transcriptional regulator [Aureimonas fodinaquatilis]
MSNSISQTDARRLYQQVADQIRSLIQEKGIEIGGRLPPERDLAQQLGVSRPSLREALIALEIEGTVEIRMGSGIYYLGESSQPTRQYGDSPSELMEARIAIETATASMAAARADAAGITRLREILRQMELELDAGRALLELDRRFHIEIAVQSGNPVLARLVGEIFESRFNPLSIQLREHFDNDQSWRAAFVEHGLILEAIVTKDALRASSQMAAHLLASGRRWEREA